MSLDGFTLSNASRRTVMKILEHPYLEFHAKVHLKKGVVYDHIQEAKYRDLHFTVVLPPFTPKVTICGNFYHYMHRLPNTGDFPFTEFLNCVDLLCEDFHLRAEETNVIKLEVGSNIRTQVHPRDVIDNVIAYKGKQKQFKDYQEKGYEGAFDFQEYLVRLYCKSCKNKLSDPVLRVELATQKSRYLKKLGIYHLSDLKKVESHVKLGQQLLDHVSDFIYDDLELDLSKLTREEVKVVQEYRSPFAWRNLMKSSPDNYRKKKRRHREIIEKYCKTNWRIWLEEQLTLSMERQLGVSLNTDVQLSTAA
jgi:hypothetical protein